MSTVDNIDQMIKRVIQTKAVQDKINIEQTYRSLGADVNFYNPLSGSQDSVAIGDDCAAIPDGNNGYLLLAAEGISPQFLNNNPWFAGYSAVLVNISDICSMGGVPVAVTDVIWAGEPEDTTEIWQGMKAASADYDVPIVGGHTSYGCEHFQLSVSILGKANKLLTSFDARPGQELLMAVNMDGEYFKDYPFWNASTDTDPNTLRNHLILLQEIANREWATAAKDISMGGIIGTLAMLLHTSGVGAEVELNMIPIPPGVDMEKWLLSFPSYGYLLTTNSDKTQSVIKLFEHAGIACQQIGKICNGSELAVRMDDVSQNIKL